MMNASQLGITRRQLDSWAAEFGLTLVPVTADDPDDFSYREKAIRLARESDALSAPGSKVYFLQESAMGGIKIGRSKQALARRNELARVIPYELTLLAVTDGDRALEFVLHKRFMHARIKGEWFRPVPELLAYIAEIKAAACAA